MKRLFVSLTISLALLESVGAQMSEWQECVADWRQRRAADFSYHVPLSQHCPQPEAPQTSQPEANTSKGSAAQSGLTAELELWLHQTCPKVYGPSMWRSCMERELRALREPGWPDLTLLTPDEQRWVHQSCPKVYGPSMWRSCITREASALATLPRAPATGVPTPRGAAPSTNRHEVPLQNTSKLAPIIPLPSWSGERPLMPAQASQKELSPKDIFLAVAPSVYILIAGQSAEELKRRRWKSFGSAVAVSSNWALTNCHVVQNQSFIALIDDKSDIELWATVVYAHEASDRCILRTAGKLRPVSAVRRSSELAVGERVYTIGNPSGLTKTLAEGLISGLRPLDGVNLVQTTAPISPGSSGGALIDTRGSLIGITTGYLKDAQNLNFAISAEDYWR